MWQSSILSLPSAIERDDFTDLVELFNDLVSSLAATVVHEWKIYYTLWGEDILMDLFSARGIQFDRCAANWCTQELISLAIILAKRFLPIVLK